MKGIGGNVVATIQTCKTSENAIREQETAWTDAAKIRGWLDRLTGDSGYSAFHAKIQQSSHVFIADYVPLPGVTAENARVVIAGKHYDVMMIDNPMEMGSGSQLEIYLKYTGG